MEVIVKTLGKREAVIEACEDELVESFFGKLEAAHGIPVKSQEVFLGGFDVMMPGHKLKEYNLCNNMIIILAKKLPAQPARRPEWLVSGTDILQLLGPAKQQQTTCGKVAATAKPKPLSRCPSRWPPASVAAIQAWQAEADNKADRREGKAGSGQLPGAKQTDGVKAAAAAPKPAATAPRLVSAPTEAIHRSASDGPVGKSCPDPRGLAPAAPPAVCAKQDQPPPAGPVAAGAAATAAMAAAAKGPPPSKLSARSAAPVAPGVPEARPGQANSSSRPGLGVPASLSWSPPYTAAPLAPGAAEAVCAEPSPQSTARLLPISSPTAGSDALPTMVLGSARVSPPATTMRTTTTGKAAPAGGATPAQMAAAMAVAGVTRIRRCDLQRIGRLGVGAFGLVTLEADRRTGRTYALKAVSKGYLAHLRMEYSVLNEKRILRMLDSPFVVRLLATYNGREHVYFLLEAALGGELFTTYERLKLYGSEVHAKFYVGCVTEALAHLHERNVVYRDLKPENLLLDVRGFCKLTDMGLAKISIGQTYTMVGTPDYMAPEVIDCSGHTRSVDWWTLGVLLFELLAGHAPFESKTGNAQETYSLVKKGIEKAKFPDSIRAEANQLVRLLCHRTPEARMRTPKLREHVFFRGFDWASLCALRLTPPLVPQVRGPRDLTNFRNCEDEDPQAMPYKDTGSGWDAGFEDDVLSSGAHAAAAQAPMLPMPTAGLTARAPGTCSATSCSSSCSTARLGAHSPKGATFSSTGMSGSSSSSAVFMQMPKVAPGSSASAPSGVTMQGMLQQAVRGGASPNCSPRGVGLLGFSAAAPSGRIGGAYQATSSASHLSKGNSGSFVPPMVRTHIGSLQSPPSSPLGGG